MPKQSAGLLLFRRRGGVVEVLLVHPGGPFWARKEPGAWSIPKGEAAPGEDLLARATLELAEETAIRVDGPFRPLAAVTQASGKVVHAWAVEADADAAAIRSNTFSMEWPPRSGHMQEFPEVDRAAWFDLATAHEKINKGQRPLLDSLQRILAA